MSQRTGHRSLAGYIDDIFFILGLLEKGTCRCLRKALCLKASKCCEGKSASNGSWETADNSCYESWFDVRVIRIKSEGHSALDLLLMCNTQTF